MGMIVTLNDNPVIFTLETAKVYFDVEGLVKRRGYTAYETPKGDTLCVKSYDGSEASYACYLFFKGIGRSSMIALCPECVDKVKRGKYALWDGGSYKWWVDVAEVEEEGEE